MSQNIDNVPGATDPQDRNKAQNQECPTEPTSTSSYHNQGLIDMRDDSEILDSRFPPLHVLQMMTKEEYTQYQKDFLRIEEETTKERRNQEDVIKEKKIKKDIPIYGRECYGF